MQNLNYDEEPSVKSFGIDNYDDGKSELSYISSDNDETEDIKVDTLVDNISLMVYNVLKQ